MERTVVAQQLGELLLELAVLVMDVKDDTGQKSESRRISLAVVLVSIMLVAVVFAGWRAYGIYGVAPACGLSAIIWFAVSRTRTPACYPINRQRMSLFDLVAILLICLMLHLITLPATGFGKPGNKTTTPAQAAPTIDSQGSEVDRER